MADIAAANNLTIQFDPTHWRLFNGPSEDGMALLTAQPSGLAYVHSFAVARRLAQDGFLPADQISMVVVGWAVEDSYWHLGLLLAPEAAQTRGSRWCGLARWPKSEGQSAEHAGRALADLLGKPFQLVPPAGGQAAGDEAPVSEAPEAAAETAETARTRAAPDVSLMPLPIDVDEWTLREDDLGLVLERSKTWYRGMLVRVLFFGLITPVFGLLSVGALLSPFASVNPTWLPLVGLAITLIMLGNTLSLLYSMLRGPITVVERRLRLLRQTTRSRRRTLVQSPFEGLEYVLISHVINRRRAKKPVGTAGGNEVYSFWAEVWVHVYSPRRGFIKLCQITDVEGRALSEINFQQSRPLHLGEIDSPAHHIGAYIGREIGIPVYVEER